MPERMCIVTRAVKDEAELIRFVRSPDGVATPDLQRKLPGRGVWVSVNRTSVEEAVRKNLFARGFGAATTASPGLAEQLRLLLRQQALSLLSLARKAGQAVTGFVKVEEALRHGPVRIILHTAGASDDGARKLDRLRQDDTMVCNFLTGDELDLAFGRANVIHAAVARGGLADKLTEMLGRVAAYEGLNFTDAKSEDR